MASLTRFRILCIQFICYIKKNGQSSKDFEVNSFFHAHQRPLFCLIWRRFDNLFFCSFALIWFVVWFIFHCVHYDIQSLIFLVQYVHRKLIHQGHDRISLRSKSLFDYIASVFLCKLLSAVDRCIRSLLSFITSEEKASVVVMLAELQ